MKCLFGSCDIQWRSIALLGLAWLIEISVAEEDTCVQQLLADSVVPTPPFVKPLMMLSGSVMEPPQDMVLADVMGCCALGKTNGDAAAVETSNDQACSATAQSTRLLNQALVLEPQTIGQIPQMNTEQTLQVLDNAKQAWNGGSGTWPQMSLAERIEAIETVMSELKSTKREQVVTTLMWEIGKNRPDAESEFDRTLSFVEQVINVVRTDAEVGNSSWKSIGSTLAFVRRAAIGIIMCLGPFNYPLNETYAAMIPALLMGNVVIMKIPTVGGLVHLLTMEAFAKILPPGTINFVSGGGRATMPPLMATGDINGLAFIGGSNAADDLIRQHPQPHRLKIFLQLEAKNMAIFLPDIFEASKEAELSNALQQSIIGSLSFNGQRCTALKLFFIPKAHGESFAKQLAKRVESLTVGLPWNQWPDNENNNSLSYSSVTPLPNKKRIAVMKRLIDDAVKKGAKILNANGGTIVGGPDSTLMVPAVLYPVTSDMEIYKEEQFGPVIPIATYDTIDTVLDYGREGVYGQQVSIFTSIQDATSAATLVDRFSSVFGKININSQCGRSPDTLPFSGRRSSAMGVMSVKDALLEFSIPTVISYKHDSEGKNEAIVTEMSKSSKFLETL